MMQTAISGIEMCNVAMIKTIIQIGILYYALSNSTSHTSQPKTMADASTREATVRSASTQKREVIELEENIREMVKPLCPMADICADNVTNVGLQPNGQDRHRRTSCCKACSCHPDCKERKNCCFPDDLEAMKDASVVHECIHTRIGREADIDGNVPAYSTVMAAPELGCVDNSPVRVTANITLTPTCDDIDITPLGFYFPVYSEDTGEIYKNILCARCHGVTKTIPFSATLVCKTDRRSKSHIPLSMYLSFLESKVLDGLCHVDFRFADSPTLTRKRCYNKAINVCNGTVGNITVTFEQSVRNFDADVIKKMCESDFYSPTVRSTTGLVYKNVFCALCGQTRLSIHSMLCHDQNEKTDPTSFAVLFNPHVMHMAGKEKTPGKIPEVCLVQHKANVKSHMKCRRTYCPTGKIRNANGHCVLVGDIFNTGGFFVQIKLTSQVADNFKEKDEKADEAQLVQNILENNPWPKDWKLQRILVRDDDIVCEEKGFVIVHMATPEKPTQAKYDDIEKSMKLPWPIRKSPQMNLSQSFLQYQLKTKAGQTHNVKGLKIPSWQAIQTMQESFDNYLSCGPMEWNLIKRNSLVNQLAITAINKLYVCDQIQLQTSEFVLGDGNVFLKSNLTKRTLYDLEFELIEDIQGVQARVCLSDTIFTAKQSNDGKSLHASAVVVLTHGFIIITVNLSPCAVFINISKSII